MTPSNRGITSVEHSVSGEDADNARAANASAPRLSAGDSLRAEAEDRSQSRRRSAPPILDAHPVAVFTTKHDGGEKRGFGPALRRHAPAGVAVLTAVGLAFLGGDLFGASRGRITTVDAASIDAAHHVPPAAPAVLNPEATKQMAQMAVDVRLLSVRVETLRQAVESRQSGENERALKRSVDALRSGLEQSKLETAKSLGQLAQKLDHLPRDPAAKLAQVAERLDQIEKRSAIAATDVTGSIDRPASATVVALASKPVTMPARAAVEPTKPVKTAAALPGPRTIVPGVLPDAKPQPKVLTGFVLRDMEGDVAIVEGHGQIFELVRGETVPGIGRVERFERHGREWMVVTSRGLIGSRSRD